MAAALLSRQQNEARLKEMPEQIAVGTTVPNLTLYANNRSFSTHSVLEGRRVVLFTVPKAFTKVCSEQHLPGFVKAAEQLRELGVTKIICLAGNTFEEMDAWFKSQNVNGTIEMIPDCDKDFIIALGLGSYDPARGLGIIANRSAMILEDKKVVYIKVEKPAECSLSSAASIVNALKNPEKFAEGAKISQQFTEGVQSSQESDVVFV